MTAYKYLRKIGLYFMSKGTTDGLLALRGIILASFLGPEAFGVWVLFRLAINYCGFAHLGVPGGLEFYAAKATGREIENRVSYWRTALGFSLVLFGVIATGVFVASFFVADETMALGMRWFSGAILTEKIWFLGLSYLRAIGNFRKFVILELTNAALHLIFSLCLAPFYGLTGAFAGFVLATTLSLILLAGPLPKRPELSFTRLNDMLKVGFPVLLSMLIGFGLASADRLIVAGNGDMALLGLYGFAFAIAGIAGSLAWVIQIVVYPEVYASVATDGEGPALEAHLNNFLLPFTQVIPPILGLMSLLIGPVIQVILPKYVDAIPAARLLMFAGATAGFERLGTLGVIAAQRQNILPFFSAGALFLNVSLSLLALRSGLGLQGVAGAAVFSNATFGLATVAFIAKRAQAIRPARYLFKVSFPLVWCAVAVFLISNYWPAPDVSRFFFSVGLYFVAMVPLFPGVLSEFRKVRKHYFLSVHDAG